MTPSNSWLLHEPPVDIVGTHGASWGLLGNPWYTSVLLGFLGDHGDFGELLGTPGESLGVLGTPRVSLKLLETWRLLRTSLELKGTPGNSRGL